MRVQHNIPAMNSYRNYNSNTSSINKNLEKLSSGYRINRAGDDAAGLAISEKMRAQITGLATAQKNAKDGISLVQTAEGALTEVHSMLNRMYELAEQSANGTYAGTDSTGGSATSKIDRAQLQKEVTALRDEINRISGTANFNGIQLFTGTAAAGAGTPAAGAGAGGGTPAATVTATLSDTTNFSSITMGTKGSSNDPIKYKVESDGDFTNATATLTVGSTIYTADIKSSSTTNLVFNEQGGSDSITLTLTNAGLTKAKGAVAGANGNVSETQIGSVDAGSGGGIAAGSIVLQIGDENTSANQLTLPSMDMAETTLKIDATKVDVSTQNSALSSLDNIKEAINKVSDYRGELGAIQNRLEHTINNLSVMRENMQDAESTIRDTDVAEEMMKYTKNSILVQSAQAMLAQANQQPQGVLQLLQ
jgi:flagellin